MATDLTVHPGRNMWLWCRTDRDGPTPDEVIVSACAMMLRTLPGTGLNVPPPATPDGPPNGSRYYISPARPLDIFPTQEDPRAGMPPGTKRWTFEEQPQPYAIKASTPWYVLCDFDWRGPVTPILEWPRRTLGPFGFAVDEPLSLDWLLVDARWISAEPGRPDSTTVQEIAKPVAEFGGKAMSLIVLLGLAYLIGGRGK
jgi:hypothetical protein